MPPNLPAQPTPLIGRGADIVEVGALLVQPEVTPPNTDRPGRSGQDAPGC